ncbi:hypothetical protein D3C87_1629080 [compost metagenome]
MILAQDVLQNGGRLFIGPVFGLDIVNGQHAVKVAHDVTGAFPHRRAQRRVHDDNNTRGHDGFQRDQAARAVVATAFSSAWTNMPATSKPVCSAISTKQVGLVTLTSVT